MAECLANLARDIRAIRPTVVIAGPLSKIQVTLYAYVGPAEFFALLSGIHRPVPILRLRVSPEDFGQLLGIARDRICCHP
jgi:hypothetical protein